MKVCKVEKYQALDKRFQMDEILNPNDIVESFRCWDVKVSPTVRTRLRLLSLYSQENRKYCIFLSSNAKQKSSYSSSRMNPNQQVCKLCIYVRAFFQFGEFSGLDLSDHCASQPVPVATHQYTTHGFLSTVFTTERISMEKVQHWFRFVF